MTVAPVSNIPVSVNYTSRDYYSLREELIARVQSRLKDEFNNDRWTASDPADFGLALVEAFAYLGDIISYYIDRMANEGIITTVTQRKNLLALAYSYGYSPAGYRQAYTTLTFSNTSASDVTLPAGTVVSGDVSVGDTVQTVSFTLDTETIVVAAVGGVAGDGVGSASEGKSVTLVSSSANAYGELIGTSDGLPAMEYQLGETPVADGSISVYVQSGDQYSKWIRVSHLADYGPRDLVYETYLDAASNVFVKFGDGVSGAIPNAFSEIRALYVVGGGSVGNVPVGTLIDIDYVPGLSESAVTALKASITVQNDAAIGGSDPESDQQIRLSAPQTLRALNRAVTLTDYANIALSVQGIGKASAKATVWTAVDLYIAPTRTVADTDTAPGYEADGTTPSAEYLTLKGRLESFIADKILIGSAVTVHAPTYVDCILDITYTANDQYTNAEAELAIQQTLVTTLGYVYQPFKATIYPQNIELILQTIPSVKIATVTHSYRSGGTVARSTLTGTESEIFRFKTANITLTPA